MLLGVSAAIPSSQILILNFCLCCKWMSKFILKKNKKYSKNVLKNGVHLNVKSLAILKRMNLRATAACRAFQLHIGYIHVNSWFATDEN